ncbi:YitT family protein [Ensifer soli]|uniref:YitT family protein n=1 Tax=Ciceribacter sp. sgz301302 TaxID=3342379 RepID=UPI0035B6BCAB
MADKARLFGFWNPSPTKHTPFEDAQGIFSGAMIAALGIGILSSAGLLTGGTAGVAFLLHYATGLSFGLMFFLVNLPFYWLSLRRLGWGFSTKTFIAIALTSLITEVQPKLISVTSINPLWSALLGGLLLGFSLLALYRHRASLGGIGILAVYLQDRFGWPAGIVQLAFDLTVLALSFAVLEPLVIGCSVVGAVTLNLFLAINHRKDRYIAL